MIPKVVFKNKSTVDVTFSINVDDLASLLKEKATQLEGRNKIGRPRALSADQVAEILAHLESGKFTQREIAQKFGVCDYVITRVKQNRYLTTSIEIEE